MENKFTCSNEQQTFILSDSTALSLAPIFTLKDHLFIVVCSRFTSDFYYFDSMSN